MKERAAMVTAAPLALSGLREHPRTACLPEAGGAEGSRRRWSGLVTGHREAVTRKPEGAGTEIRQEALCKKILVTKGGQSYSVV